MLYIHHQHIVVNSVKHTPLQWRTQVFFCSFQTPLSPLRKIANFDFIFCVLTFLEQWVRGDFTHSGAKLLHFHSTENCFSQPVVQGCKYNHEKNFAHLKPPLKIPVYATATIDTCTHTHHHMWCALFGSL